jgi:hypothetical protein
VPQQVPDLVPRVALVTSPAELLLLDAAADLIDDLAADLGDVEGVSTCTASDNESRSALA